MATGTAIPLIHGPASERLRRIATYASVAVAAVLIAVKFAAWLETGSVALLSSLVDSLLDAVASLVNLVAVRHAMSPADREHRFGHGKAEPLASRAELERRVGEFSRRFPEGAVPRPPHWSGFRVVPVSIEFWQERPFRLHDRLLFVREGTEWRRERLFP